MWNEVSSPAFTINTDQILSTLRGAAYAIFGMVAAYLVQTSTTMDQSSLTGMLLAAGFSIAGNALLKWIPSWK